MMKDWCRFEQRILVFNNFVEARDRLEAWQEARPFLYIGQSNYAQTLVHTMIDAYKQMLSYNDQLNAGLLKSLYELLNDVPPSDDPPIAHNKTVGGRFLIC